MIRILNRFPLLGLATYLCASADDVSPSTSCTSEDGDGTAWIQARMNSKSGKTDGQRAIPNRLLFNYKHNLLSDPSDMPQQAANVQTLISKYPDMKVEFLDDEGCAQAIARAHSQSLASYFRSETFGPYKSDVCRLAQLLDKGGYYLDNDLEFLSDFREAIPVDASFVSVAHPNKDIFQAFLAASPGHPLIKQTLDKMHRTYQLGQVSAFSALQVTTHAQDGSHSAGKSNLMTNGTRSLWFGPNALAASWIEFSGQQVNEGVFHHTNHLAFQKSYMFLETDAASFGLPHRSGSGCCCNFAVGDTASGRGVFFSRFVGASDFCRAR